MRHTFGQSSFNSPTRKRKFAVALEVRRVVQAKEVKGKRENGRVKLGGALSKPSVVYFILSGGRRLARSQASETSCKYQESNVLAIQFEVLVMCFSPACSWASWRWLSFPRHRVCCSTRALL